MPTTISKQHVNGIDFHVEESGSGEPLVLIHGAWGSTARWALIVDGLAESFHVVNYDRRGHGGSGTGPVPPTRLDQEDDVAGIIEGLGVGPAHVVGSSFGGSIALSLASRRPDLVRSIAVHEPPLMALAADDSRVNAAAAEMAAVVDLIEDGERETAAQAFVHRIALGPGAWDMLPLEVQVAMVEHAPAFAAEQRDAAWTSADLSGIACPVLVTHGDSSLPWFAPLIDAVQAELPEAKVVTIAGAGHVPHVTHPEEYVRVLTRWAVDSG